MAFIAGLPDFYSTDKPAEYDFNAAHRAILGQLGGQVAGRRNYVLQSETLDAAQWSTGLTTVTANATASPSYDAPNAVTADRLVCTASTGNHYIFQSMVGVLTEGDIWTQAIRIKKDNYRYFKFDNNNGAACFIDLDAPEKVVATSGALRASAQLIRNGFTVIYVTFLASALVGPLFILYFTNSSFQANIVATGTEAVFLWGAQANPGNLAPYAATTSAIVDEGEFVQLPGGLDTTNVVASAGIDNSQKAEPYTPFTMAQLTWTSQGATSGTGAKLVHFPPVIDDIFVMAAGLMDPGGTSAIFPTGGSIVYYINGVPSVRVVCPDNIKSGAAVTSFPANLRLSVGDVLTIDYADLVFNSSANFGRWTLYCKAKHVV